MAKTSDITASKKEYKRNQQESGARAKEDETKLTLKRHAWDEMNGELVPVDCICSYCGGDGYDFEGLNECDYCHGAGLSCDHTETDHQEMFDEERPLEEWQKAWFR